MGPGQRSDLLKPVGARRQAEDQGSVRSRDSESFVDDSRTWRGVVRGRAVPTLRSVKTQPSAWEIRVYGYTSLPRRERVRPAPRRDVLCYMRGEARALAGVCFSSHRCFKRLGRNGAPLGRFALFFCEELEDAAFSAAPPHSRPTAPRREAARARRIEYALYWEHAALLRGEGRTCRVERKSGCIASTARIG